MISLYPRDKKQVDWVKAYLSIWTELQAYIKEYHTTGLTWSKTVSAGCICRDFSGGYCVIIAADVELVQWPFLLLASYRVL